MIHNEGQFLGRFVKDPEFREVNTNNGNLLIANFSIAINIGKDKANFFFIKAIGKQAELLQSFQQRASLKGKQVILKYYQQNNNYQKENKTIYSDENILINFTIVDRLELDPAYNPNSNVISQDNNDPTNID